MDRIKSIGMQFKKPGDPEVLTLEESFLSNPKGNDVLIKHHAIGVNFVDSYYRSGLYPTPLPSGLGNEASGVVEAIGNEVQHLKVGDRVAYATGPLGAYCTRRLIDSRFLVKIPDEISFKDAASSMLKGLTVHYLFHKVYPLKKDQTILFHAAAGGVGLLACQWARHLGVKLIGTASSEEKALIARKHGAFEIINYQTENVAERLLAITSGEKVPVVYDSVGKDTWEISLNCLSARGLMVSFGNASGPVTGVNLGVLAQKGSLFVTRPILAHYVSTHQELNAAAQELFTLMKKKILIPDSPQIFSLKDAVKAHHELKNRKRTGSIILDPSELGS